MLWVRLKKSLLWHWPLSATRTACGLTITGKSFPLENPPAGAMCWNCTRSQRAKTKAKE